MRKINNLLAQKLQLETKVQDLQLQIKSIEERVILLQQQKPAIENTATQNTRVASS